MAEAVGHEKMSSDVEPGARYGNRESGVGVAAASAAFPTKPMTAEVRRVTLKRSSISLESRGNKNRKSREHKCKLCSAGTFISTPVIRHAVRHHLPWFVVPDTACWTCKRRLKRSLARHLMEARCVTIQVFFLLSMRYMMDTVTWTAGQLNSGRGMPVSVWQQCRMIL